MDQSEFEANACNRRKARENACGQVKIGFGFASHWCFVNQLTERSKAKPKQLSIENRSN